MPSTQHLNHKDPVAGTINETIPAIGSSHLASGDRQTLAPEVLLLCQDYGFLCVDLDQRQQKLVDESLCMMRTFFASNDATKSAVQSDCGGNGWTASGQEPAYQPGTDSNVESFDITKTLIEGYDNQKWPDADGFQQSAVACWNEFLALSDQLLDLIGRVVGVSPEFLLTNCDSRELNTFRYLHYPPENRSGGNAYEVRIAAHTDFECITLLYQSAAGLESRNTKGDWLEVPASRGRLIILFGDMLEIWTNGQIQATGHRVRRTAEERLSIVMFIAVNKGVQVKPLSRFVSLESPAAYPPVGQKVHTDREIKRAKGNLLQADR
jgi:isopenicillin N synthase-like dioxygenase